MSDSEKPLPLGVFKIVSNTERRYELESKTLHVGYLCLGSRLRPAAFTINELSRPLKRAENNKEDLPPLESSNEPVIEELQKKLDGLTDKLAEINNRSLLQRIKAVFTG